MSNGSVHWPVRGGHSLVWRPSDGHMHMPHSIWQHSSRQSTTALAAASEATQQQRRQQRQHIHASTAPPPVSTARRIVDRQRCIGSSCDGQQRMCFRVLRDEGVVGVVREPPASQRRDVAFAAEALHEVLGPLPARARQISIRGVGHQQASERGSRTPGRPSDEVHRPRQPGKASSQFCEDGRVSDTV